MRDMDKTKLLSRICEELDRIAEKGLNTSNLDTAYKLVDMYKDLKNAEYWEQKGEYYMAVLEEMQGVDYSRDGGYSMDEDGYSQRRHRNNMGRYSRNDGMDHDRSRDGRMARRGGYSQNDGTDTYDRYMDQKQSYRSTKSPECKERLLDALTKHMDTFTQQMEDMLRDSDCADERATIRRYIDKIKNMV